jgi:hypothetical protein
MCYLLSTGSFWGGYKIEMNDLIAFLKGDENDTELRSLMKRLDVEAIGC